MMAAFYKITQDRWCWCGVPAALRIEGRTLTEPIPVCSIAHGQIRIAQMQKDEENFGPPVGKTT